MLYATKLPLHLHKSQEKQPLLLNQSFFNSLENVISEYITSIYLVFF